MILMASVLEELCDLIDVKPQEWCLAYRITYDVN